MVEDFSALFRSDSDVLSLSAGDVLFSKGDVGQHAYVVKAGELQIIDGNRVFETVLPGGIVGEMALVESRPRSATVRANTESTVVPVDEKLFLYMVQQTPFFAIRLMRVLSARLRAMNELATRSPNT